MPTPSQNGLRNGLLRALPASSFERLKPHLRPVDLPLKSVISEPDQPTPDVHFIESGLVSMLAYSHADAEQIEIGHIGWEGMTNFHVVHHVDRTPNHTFVQSDATAWSISAELFREALSEDKDLSVLIGRYIHTYEIQLAQSALANGRYNMHERLARWLLMCHDRLRSDDMHITHDFLSIMLGVRRSGVTNEIQILEGLNLIRASRGLVQMRDRLRMEEVAAGSYGSPEAEYERWIGTTLSYRSSP